jgi:hypothetical protein
VIEPSSRGICAAHRQVLDQRSVEIQGAIQIGQRQVLDARPGGQIDRRWVGRVQAHHLPRRLDDVLRTMAGSQAVTAGQPRPALRDSDPSHSPNPGTVTSRGGCAPESPATPAVLSWCVACPGLLLPRACTRVAVVWKRRHRSDVKAVS